MRVLVSGGAGFVGSHVVSQLLADGHEICLYDSMLSFIDPLDWSFLTNSRWRMKNLIKGATMVRGNTQDRDHIGRCVRDFHPEIVIHLAAMPLARLAVERPEEAGMNILQGTMNVLQAARESRDIRRFVYISSSMVYGDFENESVTELSPVKPKDVYGGLKLSGEILTRVYSDLYGLKHSIVRPSAVYGPGDCNRRVIQAFIENALAGRPVTLNGATTCLDFTYVEDLAAGIVLAATHPAAEGETFNITYGRARTLLEAAQLVARLIPGLELKIDEAEKSVPRRGTLSIEKARRLLGYAPKVALEEGVERYYGFLAQMNRDIARGDYFKANA